MPQAHGAKTPKPNFQTVPNHATISLPVTCPPLRNSDSCKLATRNTTTVPYQISYRDLECQPTYASPQRDVLLLCRVAFHPLLKYQPLCLLLPSTFVTLLIPFRSQPLVMSDQSKPVSQVLYESAPSSRQTVKFLTASTIGAVLLTLCGLTLTGTVIALILTTPLLVLFSPILVPAGIAILLVISGFAFSGVCGVAAILALSWIYNYVTGKHPPGADQLDHARKKISDKARDMQERANLQGQFDQVGY